MQAAQIMTAPELKGELRYDEPMARHVSWRAGGKAKRYFIPADLDDIAVLIASLPSDEKIMWMGLGSNTLFRDEGFDGTVIAMQGVMTGSDSSLNLYPSLLRARANTDRPVKSSTRKRSIY